VVIVGRELIAKELNMTIIERVEKFFMAFVKLVLIIKDVLAAFGGRILDFVDDMKEVFSKGS
jgi:hypothetical protein